MNHAQMAMLAIGIVILAVSCFGLGWNVAESREQKALEALRVKYQEIENFVRTNWPSEYQAWKRGHSEGYQQGVLHAAELEASTEDES